MVLDAGFPGRGCAVCWGLGMFLGFCNRMSQWAVFRELPLTLDGPPARSSFPCVIGLTTPCFLLARGRDVLLGGSPDGTRTVWLL